MVILFLGAPGAGKTTLAKYASQELKLPLVDVGELLRTLSEHDPTLEREMDKGDLADPEEVNRIIFEKISQEKGDFILDGFPRTVDQAQIFMRFLESRKMEVCRLFELIVPVELLRARLLARGRDDDRMEVIEHRLEVYDKETLPVFEYFRNRGVEIIKVDNSCPLENSKKEVLGILKPAAN